MHWVGIAIAVFVLLPFLAYIEKVAAKQKEEKEQELLRRGYFKVMYGNGRTNWVKRPRPGTDILRRPPGY